MRRWHWSGVVLLLAVCACGGGSGESDCFLLGGARTTNLGDGVRVEVEVTFLDVPTSDWFDLARQFSWETVMEGFEDRFQPFGGDFATEGGNEFQLANHPVSFADDETVGGEVGSLQLIPPAHKPGSFLPRASLGPALQPGGAGGFVQAPGDNAQCLRIDPSAVLGGFTDGLLTSVVPFAPIGSFAASFPGQGIGVEMFDDQGKRAVLDMVQNDQSADTVGDPVLLSLLNGQRALAQSFQVQVPPDDLAPFVDDGLLGLKPQVATIHTGIVLDVRPVVSADRRTITLEIRPTSNAAVADFGPGTTVDGAPTTLQIPTLNPVIEVMRVAVPDGGTVLLGGLKNLADNGQALPLLSKIPYVNRLFKNTSTARDTQALMILITPRILSTAE